MQRESESSQRPGSEPNVRLAALVASLSLAGDLGLGQPWEHALRTCLLALRLGELAELAESDLRDLYYVALLRVAGCTADAHVAAELFGDEIAFAERCSTLDGRPLEVISLMTRTVGNGRPALKRARMVTSFLASGMKPLKESIRAGCEVAQVISGRLGFDANVIGALGQIFERWDGRGWPRAIKGEDVSILVRIVHVAQDWVTFMSIGGRQAATTVIRERSARNYDPAIVATLSQLDQTTSMAGLESGSVWEDVLAEEPGPRTHLSERQLEDALEAVADFADLKSPSTLGHSRGVASLAGSAARGLGFDEPEITLARRAALVHDLGRVATPASTWERRGTLSADDWERVRLHPYYTERALSRASGLAELAAIGGAHHERLDGSGYHRGSSGPALSMPARILGAADAYHAMTEPRPHRDAHSPGVAGEQLRALVRAGKLDPDAATGVLNAAGQRPPPQSDRPAGLSRRESEVLRLLCRGGTNRSMAAALFVSPKTIDTHVQHIYEKLGVSTRAAAAMSAMQYGIVSPLPDLTIR